MAALGDPVGPWGGRCPVLAGPWVPYDPGQIGGARRTTIGGFGRFCIYAYPD
jgi:hypothetical protein